MMVGIEAIVPAHEPVCYGEAAKGKHCGQARVIRGVKLQPKEL